MDALTKQVTLGFAYRVSENAKDAEVAQLLWAMDRFHYDRREQDEHTQEQRSAATQVCALELDRRGVRVGDPSLAPEFPRDFPGRHHGEH